MLLNSVSPHFFDRSVPASVVYSAHFFSAGNRWVSDMARSIITVFSCLLSATFLFVGAAEAKPSNKGGGNGGGDVYTPMSLEQERYYFRVAGSEECLGEDDELTWEAVGSLAPGESFSFSPAYPGCNGHPAAITVVSSWNVGALKLSSTVPDVDFASWDADQEGQAITAPIVGNTAQLCMFPAYTAAGVNYTITLTNNSSETVHGVVLNGRHENDWSLFYYPRCLNADADGDGWNDSLEHSMANLVYPNGYVDGVYQPDILWGSNYLRAEAQTAAADDEIDSYPPDFNDDGWVDESDLALLESQLGHGNGIALEQISPNPGALWFHQNTHPWRRYDLDGDGWVGDEDWLVVEQLAGRNVPLGNDIISPTARVLTPVNGAAIAKGKSLLLKSHVWDNAAISRVEYLVNGKPVCSVSDPNPTFGFSSPLYSCWWSVPRRATSYQLQVRVFDASGNSGTSEAVSVLSR